MSVEKRRVKVNLKSYVMVFALIAIWLLFFLLNQDTFLTPRNLSNLARQMSITGILSIGMVLIIVSGHIDLSIGSVVGLTGAIAAILQAKMGWSTIGAVSVAILVGLLIGLWQGDWVCYLKVPAFVVTLGGMMIFRGVILGITEGRTISPLSHEFVQIGQAFLPTTIGWILAMIVVIFILFIRIKKRLDRINYGFETKPLFYDLIINLLIIGLIILAVFIMNSYEGIPVPVLLLFTLVVIFKVISEHTRFGRYLYAIGGNPEAAKYSGINIKLNTLIAFVLMGLLCGIGGVVLSARLNGATTSAGTGFELDVIAACVIGGTSLMGGVGNVTGAIVGALIMASLDNGMVLLNTPTFWQYIVKGLILMFAVLIDFQTKQKD
ncbi:MAG: sugar ABC transporter permease [Brevinematales bacterium]|nr:sugar ABC transporter permease [Brevinematales bacterium]